MHITMCDNQMAYELSLRMSANTFNICALRSFQIPLYHCHHFSSYEEQWVHASSLRGYFQRVL